MDVLDLEVDQEATVGAVTAAAAKAVREDRAEVVCLGCAGMAGIAEQVSRAIGAPVVDGVTAAVRLAESLHGLELRTSKVRTYAPSPPKDIRGWPL
jgi:allantoin racemase